MTRTAIAISTAALSAWSVFSGAAFSGVATFYPSERFAGRPLYCDQFLGGGLTYDVETSPWLALDVTWYETGRVRCGDQVALLFEDGMALHLRALDAGVFYSGNYWVETWPDEKIVADLPEHLRPDGRMAWRVTGIILGDGEGGDGR